MCKGYTYESAQLAKSLTSCEESQSDTIFKKEKKREEEKKHICGSKQNTAYLTPKSFK